MLSISKRKARVVPLSPSSPLARSFIKRKLSLRKRGHTIHHISGNASTSPNIRKRGQTIHHIPSFPAPSKPRGSSRDGTFTTLLPAEPSAVVTHIYVHSKQNPINIKIRDSTPSHTNVHQDVTKIMDVPEPTGLDINKPLPFSPLHYLKPKANSVPIPTQRSPFTHADPELLVRLERLRNQYKARKKKKSRSHSRTLNHQRLLQLLHPLRGVVLKRHQQCQQPLSLTWTLLSLVTIAEANRLSKCALPAVILVKLESSGSGISQRRYRPFD